MTTAPEEVVDGQAEEVAGGESVALEPVTSVAIAAPASAGAIVAGRDPDAIIANAATIAGALAKLIDSQKLAADMGGGRKHVEVSAWQSCGAMLGALGGQPLHAETVWTRILRDPATGEPIRRRHTVLVKRYHPKNRGGGLREEVTYEVDGYDWEACVEIRTPGAVPVGRAEAMCSRGEETWGKRDDYAVRSMAETRAESRAYRRAIGWIVHMAGYSPTPLEELGHTRGAPMPQTADPAPWAQPASAELTAKFREAAAYLLGDAPDGPRVNALGGALQQDAGDVFVALGARAVVRLAKAHKELTGQVTAAGTSSTEQEAEQVDAEPVDEDLAAADATAPPEGPAPGTVPPPDAAGSPIADITALRAAGCICPSPLEAGQPSSPPETSDVACPIQGHGIAF